VEAGTRPRTQRASGPFAHTASTAGRRSSLTYEGNDTAALNSTNQTDVVLVGAGIMSATLAVFLKELDPHMKIEIHEALEGAAQESSNAWNNARTGHAALCKLNYTPQQPDGSIDISKALEVNTDFDLSRQAGQGHRRIIPIRRGPWQK
jgi:hypothetical protein